MNIEKTTIDELKAEIVIQIEPSDYTDRYEKALKNYRKRAQIPGFRPGHVPVSLVKQRFGKSLLVEEINTVLQDAIFTYISEQKLDVLGNPLPVFSDEAGNWDNPGDFRFTYEVGLAPKFELVLDKKQSFTYHRIRVDNDLTNRQVKDYARRYGAMSSPEISDVEDMLSVRLEQLDENNQVKEGGISNNTTVSIEYIKDEATRTKLIGLKVQDSVEVNPHLLSENHEDLAKMLGITHHDVHHLEGTFRLTVTEIKRIAPHELNQELFDKIFPGGTITSEEEFRSRIQSDLEKMFEQDSDWMFKKDFAVDIVNRVNPSLPDDFLKRWISASNEKPIAPEVLDVEYPAYAQSLRWQLIENKIIKDNEVKVTVQDALDHVKGLLASRFMQYGIPLEEDRLEEMAKETLAKKEEAKNVYDTLYENQIMQLVKTNCTIEEKVLSYDEFVHRVQH